MAKPFLSVIIPAHNEAERLPLTLIDVDQYLAMQEYSYEIIVVNDGSTDRTGDIAKNFAPLVRNLKCIDSSEHLGRGAALRIGMVAAKGNWRLAMDADNAIPIDTFGVMEPYLRDADVGALIASRRVRGARIKPPFPIARRVAERCVNAFALRMLKFGVRDSLIGFKCFSGDAANAVFTASKLNSWALDVEALALAHRLGYGIREVPASGRHVPGSYPHCTSYLRMVREIIRLWWWLNHGKYDSIAAESLSSKS